MAQKPNSGNWFVERRLDYIDWRMWTAGALRRADIERNFGVSQAQASLDINEFIRRFPKALAYDASAKQYVPAAECYQSVRGMSGDVARALSRLASSGYGMAWK